MQTLSYIAAINKEIVPFRKTPVIGRILLFKLFEYFNKGDYDAHLNLNISFTCV